MLALLKRLFCRHRSVTFVRNIHGEEIVHSGYKRSVWKCKRCGGTVLRPNLVTSNLENGNVPRYDQPR